MATNLNGNHINVIRAETHTSSNELKEISKYEGNFQSAIFYWKTIKAEDAEGNLDRLLMFSGYLFNSFRIDYLNQNLRTSLIGCITDASKMFPEKASTLAAHAILGLYPWEFDSKEINFWSHDLKLFIEALHLYHEYQDYYKGKELAEKLIYNLLEQFDKEDPTEVEAFYEIANTLNCLIKKRLGV